MRKSLEKSIADSVVQGFERYPKGSIVLCNQCALPIFKLDYGISLGSKAGSMASAFKPMTAADLDALSLREDIDAGLRAVLRSWTLQRRRAHLARMREVRSGDPMRCPACEETFVQVLSVEKTEALDKAYTIELLTVPPEGHGRPAPIRGRQLGAHKEWLH